MTTMRQSSLQNSLRWLRRIMTIILIVVNFAGAVLTGVVPAQAAQNLQATDGNLVLNPGFEIAGSSAFDAANWSEGANHTRASDKFHTGGWSLHSTFRGTGTDTRITVPITVSSNTTYTYSGYVWRTNSIGGSCLDMNDIVGERQLCTAVSGSWQFLSGTWNSASNTSVTLRLITDGSPTGDIWFDDISLTGSGPTATPTNTTIPTGDPVIAAAGDIACDPQNPNFNNGNGTATACRQKYTSDLLVNAGLAAVLPLGDNQLFCGSYQAFMQSYDLSWGRVKSITRPVVGNHEYLTSPDPNGGGGTGCTSANAGASGHFQYYGAAAGEFGKGYYSYNLGAWHLIALNSNCSDAGGCTPSSPQGQWLAADLAANQNMCTLAYWHIPLYSSGGRAAQNMKDVWQILYDAGVEVVLAGHDHIYERFAPQTANGTLDTARGIQEFIVGNGGANLTSIVAIAPNSQVRNNDTYGVLKLTLHPTSYDWQLVPEAGKTFTDSGSRNCFNASTQPTATPTIPTITPIATKTSTATPTQTTPPSSLTFNPVADAYVNASVPTTNYGTASQIRVDGSPIVNSYLKFNVQGLPGQVASAQLRIYANSSSGAGVRAFGVLNTSWAENTITYNNAPALGSQAGSIGGFAAGTWITIDITPLITGNGTFSVALTGIDGTAISLASRESGANAPQLIITTR